VGKMLMMTKVRTMNFFFSGAGVAFFVLVMKAVVMREGTNEEIEQVAEDCMVERWRQG